MLLGIDCGVNWEIFLSTGRDPRFVGQGPQETTGAQGTTGHWSLCQGKSPNQTYVPGNSVT